VKLILFFQPSVDFTKIEREEISLSLSRSSANKEKKRRIARARAQSTVQIKEVFSPFATKKLCSLASHTFRRRRKKKKKRGFSSRRRPSAILIERIFTEKKREREK